MPRIINAYNENSALGKTIADLGEAMFGDQAQKEVYRQKAFGLKRENDNIPLLADAAASGDRNAIARYGVLAGKTGQDAADFNRLAVSNHASGVDDLRLALATMGAGGAFSSTAAGQGRDLANRSGIANIQAGASRDVAHIQADKQAASDKYKFDNTFEQTYDDNPSSPTYGRTVLTPRSQAAGREAAPTKDSVVGGMLRRVADTQQPGATPAAAADPFSSMSPRWQKIAGVDLPEQSLIEPRSGTTGISRDGGQTVILSDGRTVPATGFQPVSQETALGQARDNNVRASAAQPLTAPNPASGRAAADAAATSGLGPKLSTFLNEDIGAIPGATTVLKAATGSPQIAPAVQEARQSQEIRNNLARTVLLGAPGRQTVQAQKWVNDLLPQGNALANPATEAGKIPVVVNALKADHEQYRQLALDPNTAPQERAKAVQAMHQIENTVRLFTEPAAGPPPPQETSTPTAGRPTGPAQPAAADPLAQARDAIARGADSAAVRRRLQQNGIDPSGLDVGQAPPPPKIGEMRDGYSFQGGDPADPNNWWKPPQGGARNKPQQVIQNGHTYTLQPDGSYQ
ncbi:hypothetical protein [Bradyrhizobium sp. Gha]|uniref:hypothetical protein n=1 Tax=Bradyrhizobium sp. Gha TaxID=1855318 RepID=UPI0008EB5C6A|nr:hypothetical protein [Bradyrhizobium sp. Gha]SFI39994.1 hypothetical protein SAMN05216525_10873 [Bradyrhizobium sp. Gha]